MIAAAPVASGRDRAATVLAGLKSRVRETAGSGTWAGYDATTRLMLVGMCTERSASYAASLPWEMFTDEERDSMGAAVAFFRSEFSPSKPLR